MVYIRSFFRLCSALLLLFLIPLSVWGKVTASVVLTNDLQNGDTGAQVVQLQTFLTEKGFLTMPKGALPGVFGLVTKAAVSAYQKTKKIPMTGIVGPRTRQAIASDGQVVVVKPLPVPSLPPPVAITLPLPPPRFVAPSAATPLLSAVATARQLLQTELATRAGVQKKKTVSVKPGTLDIVLAIWNNTTNSVALVNATKSGKKISLRGVDLPIQVVRENGLSTRYKITDGMNIVVGEIYPTYTQRTVKRKKVYDLKEIVYVPPSEEFFTPSTYAAGSDYLSFLIQDAYSELRTKQIFSVAFPDKKVADVIDPFLIKSIIVSEHTSPQSLLRGDSEGTMEAFLVNLAINQDDAYDQSLSTAGAVGLAQFIRSTYALMVKKRPAYALIPDFVTGMRNHQNAIKAQVALLDSDLSTMPQDIKNMYASGLPAGGEFLAAAYNGGAARVKAAWAAWGEKWAENRGAEIIRLSNQSASLKSEVTLLKRKIKKSTTAKVASFKKTLAQKQATLGQTNAQLAELKKVSLRQETVWYVAKVQKLQEMFMAGMYATPNAPATIPERTSPAVVSPTVSTATIPAQVAVN